MIGLAFALAMHAAALYGLWSYRLLPTPEEAATLFVNLIAPPKPEPKVEERPKPPPPREVKLEKPRPIERPPQQLVVEAPVTTPSEPVAPPPPKLEPLPPIEAAPAPPAPRPAAPVQLGSELSVSCPERSPPAYPAQAKRLGETGRVVLRVELDETGKVSSARVNTSSGSARLDEASLAAVKQWHCTPARRDGEPVRAVALQPFDFILEGR
jgi:protein TonB